MGAQLRLKGGLNQMMIKEIPETTSHESFQEKPALSKTSHDSLIRKHFFKGTKSLFLMKFPLRSLDSANKCLIHEIFRPICYLGRLPWKWQRWPPPFVEQTLLLQCPKTGIPIGDQKPRLPHSPRTIGPLPAVNRWFHSSCSEFDWSEGPDLEQFGWPLANEIGPAKASARLASVTRIFVIFNRGSQAHEEIVQLATYVSSSGTVMGIYDAQLSWKSHL